MLLFSHLRKTGGSSILAGLHTLPELRILHASVAPIVHRPTLKQQVRRLRASILPNFASYDVIFGHFSFSLYRTLLRDSQVHTCMTFRDPIERFCSDFFYYQQTHPHEQVDILTYLHSKQFDTQLAIYLGPLSVIDLDHVWLYEEFEASRRLFNQQFNLELPTPHTKVTQHKPKNYTAWLRESGTYPQIAKAMEHNREIYHQATAHFAELKKTYHIA